MELTEVYAKLSSYCAYQERCVQDVREKMRDLGISDYAAQHALMERLKEEDFLDERRFAKLFARSKFHHNQWGRRKIAYSMQQKQVPAALIAIGLAELDDEDYHEQLFILLEKKHALLGSKHKPQEMWQKLMQYALSKGYEADDIRPQLKRLLGATS